MLVRCECHCLHVSRPRKQNMIHVPNTILPPPPAEAKSFDDEWQQEVSKFRPLGPMLGLEEPGPRGVRQAALPGAEQEPRSVRRSRTTCRKMLTANTHTHTVYCYHVTILRTIQAVIITFALGYVLTVYLFIYLFVCVFLV